MIALFFMELLKKISAPALIMLQRAVVDQNNNLR